MIERRAKHDTFRCRSGILANITRRYPKMFETKTTRTAPTRSVDVTGAFINRPLENADGENAPTNSRGDLYEDGN